MRISHSKFGNEIPILADHLLPDGYAKQAQNCNTEKGMISSFRAPSREEAISLTTCKSVYQHTENSNDHWVVDTTARHYCKSPISGDSYERAYFTGEAEARFFANDNVSGGGFDDSTDYYKLGIPAPATAPTVTTTGGGAVYRGYVYAFVNSYGEEGPPSPVGSDDDYNTGYVTIDSIEAFPSTRAIDRIYLYRTNASGTGSAEFQFVLEATLFDDGEDYVVGDYVIYDDGGGQDLYKCTTNHSAAAWNGAHFTQGENVADADLLSVFPKTNFDPPPSGLTNLISLASGSFCGFVGNIVYFSEPFLPHAWPSEYQISVDMTIESMAHDKNEITVTGNGRPYVLYGSHPSTMSRVRSSEDFPGLDIRGACSGNGGRFFVSKRGIIFNSGEEFTNIIDNLIDTEEWAAYNHTSVHLTWYNKKLFVFDSVSEEGFFIDFSKNILSIVPLNIYFHATHVATDGELYFVQDDIDAVDENDPPVNMPLAVKKWEGSSYNYLLFTYQSPEFILDKPMNFGAAYVVIDQEFYNDVIASLDLETLNAAIFAAGLTGSIGVNGPIAGGHEIAGDEMLALGQVDVSTNITFKLYVNDTLRKTKVVSDIYNQFRLPSGYSGKRVYYEISGYIPVKKVSIAPTMEEL